MRMFDRFSARSDARVRRRGPLAGLSLLLALTILTAASCGSTTRKPSPQPAPDAQQILHDALFTSYVNSAGAADVATYDPAQVNDAASRTLATLIYPSLVTLDAQLNVRLWAAESMDISANGLTITFHLRSGMRFSDGEPINAQTFAYSLNRALDPCVKAPFARYLYPIADASAFNQENCVAPEQDGIAGPITTLIGQGQALYPQDPLTLVITLAQPAMPLLSALATPVAFAVPQSLVQQYGQAWTTHLTDHGGIGGGLFQLTRTQQQGGLRLTRNTAFWGAAPRLREVDYHFYATPSQAYAAYQAGSLDIGYPTGDQVASAPKSAGIQSTPLLRVVYLGINWRSAPFTDQRIRQAFALAIDKQSIVAQQLRNLVIPTNHIVPEGMPSYNPALVGPDSSQHLTGDTSQAVNLAQAYASSACSGAFTRCPSIALEVPAEDANASVVAADIARMWQAVAPGYPLTIRVEPAAQVRQRELSGEAQFYLDEWVAAYPDAQDALGGFTPAAPGVSGSVNLPDATTLLATANTEQDATQRAKDYQAAEQLLVSAVAVIPLYQEQFFWQTPARVQNVAFDPQGQMSVYDTMPSVVIMLNPQA